MVFDVDEPYRAVMARAKLPVQRCSRPEDRKHREYPTLLATEPSVRAMKHRLD